MKHPGQPPTPLTRSIVLGTAGHIDHGKTALVHALTGTNTDTLPQERARGITIDLGFAALKLAAPDGTPVQASIVDVPGHHAFIRNMVAGVAGIDCVLLIVAANEGVKPQTLEHLQICQALGIRHGLLVLTKADLVPPSTLVQTRKQVLGAIADTFLASSPILSVSAQTGAGLSELKAGIADLALSIPLPCNESVLRLPVDRAFSVHGAGTVVTGTLQAGTVTLNDLLELQPASRSVRVRGIQVHKAPAKTVHGPARVALNLAREKVTDLRRGHMLVAPESVVAITVVDVDLRPVANQTLLRHRSRVRVHALAAETTATLLHCLDSAQEPDSPMFARLVLREPLVLIPGDRFILRQLSPAATVASGFVLDTSPRRQQRKAQTLRWLQRLQTLSREQQLLARIGRAGTDVSLRDLVGETGLNRSTLIATLEPAVKRGEVLMQQHDAAPRYVLSETATAASESLLKRLKLYPGKTLTHAELQSQSRLSVWLFSIAWDRLLRQPQVRTTGDRIHLQLSSATPQTQELLARVEAIYKSAGLASPLTSEAAATLGITGAALVPWITQLIRQGRLRRMGADNLLIHTEALASLEASLQRYRGESFDVARFKAMTGLSRKHAIPLLEYLDGRRVFRNVNGERTVL